VNWDGQSVTKSTSIKVEQQTLLPTLPPQPTLATQVPSDIATAPPTASPPAGPITLTNPQAGQTVPCENTASGTYSLDLKEYIWPIVYVAGRYHPQDEGGKAAQKVEGNWFQTVRFGVCDQPQRDVGKSFQLIIVTADKSANAVFEEYIRTAASKNWQGLSALPPGAKEYVRIAVIRQ
jgi:hypothetical protein